MKAAIPSFVLFQLSLNDIYILKITSVPQRSIFYI